MALSTELISEFVKITNDEKKQPSETTLYGTAVEYNGQIYVRLDGSDRMTPVTTTTNIKAGERVMVLLKKHTATVTGNLSTPSARDDDVKEVDKKVQNVSDQISEFEIIVADKVSTDQLEAAVGRIIKLETDNITVNEKLTANEADISNLKAKDVEITGTLTANSAKIDDLEAKKLDAAVADITYATIGSLDATNANIRNLNADFGTFKDLTTDKFAAQEADIKKLNTDKLSAVDADIKFATIGSLEATDAKINNLEAVSITTNNIKANIAKIDLAEIKTLYTDSAFINSLETFEQSAIISTVNTEYVKDLIVGHATIQDLFTNNFTIGSDSNGTTIMNGSTMQFKDSSGNVYVQIGTDSEGGHSLIIKDETGTVLLNGSGVTENAIADELIVNSMVKKKDGHYNGISSDKLDIDSVVISINEGTTTIKSSVIYFDEEKQTLNTKLSEMQSKISEEIKQEISDNGVYQVWIESSEGNVLTSTDSSTLTCSVKKGNDEYDLSGTYFRYEWHRIVNGIDDSWYRIGKSISISALDFVDSAVYICELKTQCELQNGNENILTDVTGKVLQGYITVLSANINVYRSVKEELHSNYYTKEESKDSVMTILGSVDLTQTNSGIKDISDKTNKTYDTAEEHTRIISDVRQTLNGNNILRNSETLIFDDYLIGIEVINSSGLFLTANNGVVLIV